MTPQELIDRVTARLSADDYARADGLLAEHGRALWDRLTEAQRRELDGLAQLAQVGRDALATPAPPATGGVAAR